jgi:DNA-binding NarL/FixJ family response regulator
MMKSLDTGAVGGTLTTREREVLQHICQGLSHKEIARAFNLAEITVKVETQRIVQKLGVRNRSAAIAKAVREGLV